VRCRQRLSGVAILTLGACALLVIAGAVFSVREMILFAIVLGLINVGLLFYKNYRLGQILHHVLEIVAQTMSLAPAGKR